MSKNTISVKTFDEDGTRIEASVDLKNGTVELSVGDKEASLCCEDAYSFFNTAKGFAHQAMAEKESK